MGIKGLKDRLDDTTFKSLKYGHDRPGGGDSGQPYEKVDINTVDRGFNRLRMTNFDDGLIRGGAIGAANASIVDTLRIGKFLTDFPKGPLFIVKQVGLQLSNPRLEVPKDFGNILSGSPDNALSFATNGLLQSSRIYNLGFNTIAQVPLNAFGGHLNRHGLLPVQDDSTKYLAVAQYNNQGSGKNNRLVGLANKFNLGKNNTLSLSKKETGAFLSTLFTLGEEAANIFFNSALLPARTSVIDDYFGGPGSTYGVGRTLIKRYAPYTVDTIQAVKDKENPNRVINNFSNTNDLGVGENAISNYDINISTDESEIKAGLNLTAVNYSSPSLKTYAAIKNQIDTQKLNSRTFYNSSGEFNNLNKFGIYGTDILSNNQWNDQQIKENQGNLNDPEWLPTSLDYPEYFNGTSVIRIKMPWNKATREIRVGSGKQDQINLTPIFSDKAGTIGDKVFIPGVGFKNINDLVKFRIQALDGDNPTQADWMIFRAYITQFSDNTDATWNAVKYAGRGEDFYIYGGFSRKISIGFKVAALSSGEMQPMYQKLNYLMGNLMPDYNGILMRGPIVKMTVGNWLDGQDGILNNISYTIPNDSPWEIALNEPLPGGSKELVLPHIIEVNMTFTPIGSQTKGDNLISKKSYTTSHIAQNQNQNDYQFITGSIQSNNINLVKQAQDNLKPNPQSVGSVSDFEEGLGPQ
jgi:hypothetical protein